MEFVVIGKIINTFGIKGEVKVQSHTDFEKDRFKTDSVVYIGEKHIPLTVKAYRVHKGFIMLSFKEYDNINQVLEYKDMYIYKSIKDIPPLKEGEYYFKDLENLDVYFNGKHIGKCLYVEEGKAYNFLRIKENNDKEVLVPNIAVFIDTISLDDKRIVLKDVEGLLWRLQYLLYLRNNLMDF